MYQSSQADFLGNLCSAIKYYDAGLNVIPLRCDGSKAPYVRSWKEYQTERASRRQVLDWFAGGAVSQRGIGVVCGATSGHLEILDFDAPGLFKPWARLVPGDLLRSLAIVGTPDHGWHAYYRCSAVAGNQGLAWDEGGVVQIETRGQGGYAVAPGSPLAVHPSGRAYRLAQGCLSAVPTIAPEQRETLHNAAKSFNRLAAIPKSASVSEKAESRFGLRDLLGDLYDSLPRRPGDDFNDRATWADLLDPLGWESAGHGTGQTELWRRPGKGHGGISATTNYMGSDLLYVFSSSVPKLAAGESYTKFAVFALLHCNGDFREAAKRLAERGFGD